MSEILEKALPFAALDREESATRAAFESRPVPGGERGIRKGLEWLRLFRTVRERTRSPP